MTERITIDASAWTGRGDYADDLRISLTPPRKLWHWWRNHLRNIPLPALLVRSGTDMWGYCRGLHIGFILCPWRDEGEISWLFTSWTPYRSHSRERLAERGLA